MFERQHTNDYPDEYLVTPSRGKPQEKQPNGNFDEPDCPHVDTLSGEIQVRRYRGRILHINRMSSCTIYDLWYYHSKSSEGLWAPMSDSRLLARREGEVTSAIVSTMI